MKQVLPNPRDDDDRQVLRDVAESGCHIIGVLADETGPAYAYSIGLFHNYNHAEILVFGLEHVLMQSMINGMRDEIRRGRRFIPGSRYSGIISDFDCEFRKVDSSHDHELFGYAEWFYAKADFPVVQCFWPDKQGHFPWEPGFNPNFIHLQPTYEHKS
jgi:hypothetical protein